MNIMSKKVYIFTLVELLVVIAVIIILIGILLPGLNTARAMAKSVYCKNKLKTLSTLMGMYIDDYKGYYPQYYNSDSTYRWWSIVCTTEAGSIVKDWDARTAPNFLACPAARPPAWGWPNDLSSPKNVSYGMNYAYLSGAMVIRFKNPSNTVAFADIHTAWSCQWIIFTPSSIKLMNGSDFSDDWEVADWHTGNRCNIMWLDGHVSDKKEVELYDSGKKTYFETSQ